MIKQRTLDHAIRCSGIGLHSGKKIKLVLNPAEVDTGIVFVRSDLGIEIKGHVSSVVDTTLCTTIGHGEATIATVEHIMSALAGLGVDNVRIEVDGAEVPVMDGSASPFIFLIQCAGIVEQNKAKKVLRIKKRVSIEDENKSCALYPASGFRVSYLLDYPHPLLSNCKVSFDFSRQGYAREVSRARTFGFIHEVEALQKAGLALGGSMDNAVVLDKYGVLNEGGLRYADECARHKVLDTVGDLFLAGYPIVGAFEGERSGHAMNCQLVQALLADESAWVIEELEEPTAITEESGFSIPVSN
ncbi:MAG TPA: UDP-3-O-acyl-N-acetylglucosamine deacetylase [Mariprofundaceae bacterium]|nr:UDP-3-O-acyl-N-acetylglucosamine deacetylase [Mariprofundaceae bacterium]